MENRACHYLNFGLWETKFKPLSLWYFVMAEHKCPEDAYNALPWFLSCTYQKKVTEGPPSRKSLTSLKISGDYALDPYISYLKTHHNHLKHRQSPPFRGKAIFTYGEITIHGTSMVFNPFVVTDSLKTDKTPQQHYSTQLSEMMETPTICIVQYGSYQPKTDYLIL